MFVMFSAVDDRRPKRRGRGVGEDAGSGAVIAGTSHREHAGAIGGEVVSRPGSGRRKIVFPVFAAAHVTDEGFETGMAPEPVGAHRRARLGQTQGLEVASQAIEQHQFAVQPRDVDGQVFHQPLDGAPLGDRVRQQGMTAVVAGHAAQHTQYLAACL
jgi:hypothetical protein